MSRYGSCTSTSLVLFFVFKMVHSSTLASSNIKHIQQMVSNYILLFYVYLFYTPDSLKVVNDGCTFWGKIIHIYFFILAYVIIIEPFLLVLEWSQKRIWEFFILDPLLKSNKNLFSLGYLRENIIPIHIYYL